MTDAQLVEYLKNKNQGGRNFEKGDRYENRFAVTKIASAIRELLEDGTDAKIEAQLLCR